MSAIDLALLRRADRRSLAKTMSLIESKRACDREFVLEMLQKMPACSSAQTMRIGITGAPGVGKSTLISSLGLSFLASNKTPVAVLTIDPSSPKSGGSILGDKVRMAGFANQERVFVRPLRSDLADTSVWEMIHVCEFAGFNPIIIETVGVGQVDYRVRNLVDLVLMITLPQMGDVLQYIKKGLNELTDIFVINKTEDMSARELSSLLTSLCSALQLSLAEEEIDLYAISALQGTGVDKLYQRLCYL